MMFESFSKKRNLRIPRRTEVLTIFGLALGLPVVVLVRLRLNFDRSVFYVLGLCLLGGTVALVFRSFRPPDAI